MISPQAATAKVEVAVEVEPGLPRVVADARRVRQVLVNLMTNAVKFTATGGHVCIEARYLPEEGAEVVISDSGRGMSDAEIATLSAGGPPGVARRRRGIGLPLSRALAEANGARLTIDSRPGAGTTVRIRFPLSCVVPP
jgi:signal transduction histidine kinase